jgi:hypothetical protein
MAAVSLPAFGLEFFQSPARFGELAFQAHVLIDERDRVDVALTLRFARRPHNSELPHPIRPAPTLDDDLFTAALEDPLILHEPRYRFVSGKTLLEVGRDEEDETIIIGAPKHLGATGGPVRAFAVT